MISEIETLLENKQSTEYNKDKLKEIVEYYRNIIEDEFSRSKFNEKCTAKKVQELLGMNNE